MYRWQIHTSVKEIYINLLLICSPHRSKLLKEIEIRIYETIQKIYEFANEDGVLRCD